MDRYNLINDKDKDIDGDFQFQVVDVYPYNRDLLGTEERIKNLNDKNILVNTKYNNDIELDYNSDSDEETGTFPQNNAFEKKWKGGREYKKQYIVDLFGTTKNGLDVCLHVINFKPYFFIISPRDRDVKAFAIFLKDYLLKEYGGKMSLRYRRCLKHISVIEMKSFYGFRNNEKDNFIKIEFNNDTAKKDCANALKKELIFNGEKIKLELYESNLESVLRFFHNKEIQPAGWIKPNKIVNIPTYERKTNCLIELSVDYNNLQPINRDDNAKILICSFDIECASSDGSSFPNFNIKDDYTIQIGSTFRFYGDDKSILKTIITLKKCSPIDGVAVISCDTEKDVLLSWSDLIKRIRPDVITGYNIFGFDFEYICERARYLGIFNEFVSVSKIKDKVCRYDKRRLQSSALGDNLLKFIRNPGTINIDMLKILQNQMDEKLGNYKLDFVSQHYLGERKEDLKPKEMWSNFNAALFIETRAKNKSFFDKDISTILPNIILKENRDKILKVFKEKDLEKLHKLGRDLNAEIAIYCIQDTELVHNLIAKRQTIINSIGMSNVCYVPTYYLFTRGTGIKVFSLISKLCNERGYIIPEVRYREKVYSNDDLENRKVIDGLRIKGAFVVEPTPGTYNGVAVLDVNSMYPSVMRAYNLSHDTCVLDPIYDNLPDVKYRTIKYHLRNETEIKARFVHEDNCAGVLPNILKYLVDTRKSVRKRLEEIEKNHSSLPEDKQFEAKSQMAVLNGRQLAFKVVGNSVYGCCGSKMSPIYLQHIAGCTTITGQKFIKYAKEYVEYNYEGSEIVYGDTDSIFIKFALKTKREDFKNDRDYEQALLKESFDYGNSASEGITTSVNRPPLKIELEKVFSVLALLSKKRYSGLMYVTPDIDKGKRKDSGHILVRRDPSKLAKHICGQVMDSIIQRKDLGYIKYLIDEFIKQTYKGEFGLEFFSKKATLRSHYKNPPVHRLIADRMAKEDNVIFQNNEYVHWCYCQIPPVFGIRGKPKKPQKRDQAFNPIEIIKKSLKLDYKLYLSEMVMSPLLEILVNALHFEDAKDWYMNLVEKYEKYSVNKINYEKEKLNEVEEDNEEKNIEEVDEENIEMDFS